MALKDEWNSLPPSDDKEFAKYVAAPGAGHAAPGALPGRVPEPRRPHRATRADLLAILLTGIPAGIVPGFQNFTGHAQADMLRLNMAIPPASSRTSRADRRRPGRVPERAPRRRTTSRIELRAIAGVTYPLVDQSYTPDGAAGEITDGTAPKCNPAKFLHQFPYLGVPNDGFHIVPPRPA